jgi:hypothetical protein
MKSKIELDGNTYFIIGSKEEGYVVSKKHGDGTKEVTNLDRAKQIIELAAEVVAPEVVAPVIETKAIEKPQQKPSKKNK